MRVGVYRYWTRRTSDPSPSRTAGCRRSLFQQVVSAFYTVPPGIRNYAGYGDSLGGFRRERSSRTRDDYDACASIEYRIPGERCEIYAMGWMIDSRIELRRTRK